MAGGRSLAAAIPNCLCVKLVNVWAMSGSVGLVVPAFRPDVDRLLSYLDAITAELDIQTVRIELDAPSDAVRDRLSSAELAVPCDLNAVPYRRGKGAAITAGFEALETDVLAFVDDDGATPAAALAAVVDPVADGRAGLAAGSRRHPDATIEGHQTVFRRFLGDGFAWLARRLLDARLYDYQCGAKAISRSAWRVVRDHLFEAGFAWDVELLAVADALDVRIEEVPITWRDQPGSTVSPVRTVLQLGWALLRARHRARLIERSRLHRLLDDRRPDEPALIDREHS